MGGPRGMRPDWNRPPMHGGGQFQQGPPQGHPQGPPHMQQQGGPPRGPPPQQMVSRKESFSEMLIYLISPPAVPVLEQHDGRLIWSSSPRQSSVLQPGPRWTTTTSQRTASADGRSSATTEPLQPGRTPWTVARPDGWRWRSGCRRSRGS